MGVYLAILEMEMTLLHTTPVSTALLLLTLLTMMKKVKMLEHHTLFAMKMNPKVTSYTFSIQHQYSSLASSFFSPLVPTWQFKISEIIFFANLNLDFCSMCVLPTSLLEFITVYTTMTHKVTCILELPSVSSWDTLSNIHGYLSSSG